MVIKCKMGLIKADIKESEYRYSDPLVIKSWYRGQMKTVTPQESNNTLNLSENSTQKKLKYFLFDKLFCNIFYQILNISSFGINLEIIAIKR